MTPEQINKFATDAIMEWLSAEPEASTISHKCLQTLIDHMREACQKAVQAEREAMQNSWKIAKGLLRSCFASSSKIDDAIVIMDDAIRTRTAQDEGE